MGIIGVHAKIWGTQEDMGCTGRLMVHRKIENTPEDWGYNGIIKWIIKCFSTVPALSNGRAYLNILNQRINNIAMVVYMLISFHAI